MEIISYVIEGQLTHEDSMGNKSTLTRGQIQYMSAGNGVVHSEMNYTNHPLR
jgi:redox-sensitive bicupin YhaK (pirin superfamily)